MKIEFTGKPMVADDGGIAVAIQWRNSRVEMLVGDGDAELIMT